MTARSEHDNERIVEWLAAKSRDPVEFARHVADADVWPVQASILRALTTDRRIAAKACHSSGKTYSAALAVLWWLIRFTDGIVVTTAPTWNQVRKLLWGEIHASIARAAGLRFLLSGVSINQTEIKLGPQNYAVGLSTNEGVNFQGFHGRVLIVLDEAPGVRPDIYEAIEGIRAGGDVRVLALGNPVIASGPFYEAFTAERSRWRLFTISAFDVPNLAGLTIESLLALPDEALDDNPRPYLTTRRWVREKYDDWGPESPLYQSRVLGQFPKQSEDALISLAWLESASQAEHVPTSEPFEAGVDVAGPGEDETSLTVRRGPNLLHTQAWPDHDPRGQVAVELGRFKAMGTLRVKVDSIGQGYYFARHLADIGFDVEDVNVANSPTDTEKYKNLKAELYWALRMRFAAGDVRGKIDDKTQGQLASIRYSHNSRGQIVIESKEDARKRGVKSPDRAESMMIAFAPPRYTLAMPTGGTSSNIWR